MPRLRAAGFPVADLAVEGSATRRSSEWATAAAGGSVVVGTRNAAWAPAPEPALMMIVDEHDESHQSTRMPTWHARDVLAERSRRANVPLVQLTPCPTLEALSSSRLITPGRGEERDGWPALEIVDRNNEDPRTATSVLSERLAGIVRRPGRIVCVLNRTGRARLLACRRCGTLARCEHCGAAVGAPEGDVLVCPRCRSTRPEVCLSCGSGAFKVVRIGVTRAREELEALVGEPVTEVTAATEPGTAGSRVSIGTEAVLHRASAVAAVVFLDIDGELTAPRFRASEQAMALLARAARLLGPRSRGHRLVVQTRLPDHPVLTAVARADPGLLVDTELPLRETLGFPPFAALAQLSGPGADEFAGGVDAPGVEALAAGDGRWLIKAPDHDRLAAALGGVPRPEARLRIEVDPLRV